jgi:hypothetical protein
MGQENMVYEHKFCRIGSGENNGVLPTLAFTRYDTLVETSAGRNFYRSETLFRYRVLQGFGRKPCIRQLSVGLENPETNPKQPCTDPKPDSIPGAT